MGARYKIERILQDGDDYQTRREWFIEVDGVFLDIRRSEDSPAASRILIHPGDVDQLIVDLTEAKRLSEGAPR